MNSTIDPGAQIGHVHLKVAELDRAVAFYRDVLGFQVTGRIGDQLAFLAAGGYHHHIGLNTLESAAGAAPAPGTTGLYHAAIRYPTRAALAQALTQVLDQRLSRQPRLGPRCVGVRLPDRPRRQRARALLGPPAGGVAAHARRRARARQLRRSTLERAGAQPLTRRSASSAAREIRSATSAVRLAPAAEHVGGDDLRVGRVRPADADPHAVEVRRAELALRATSARCGRRGRRRAARGCRRTAGRSRRAGRARGRGRA